MAMLHESYLYQESLREGEARGEVSGKPEGIISIIERILKAKFCEDALQLLPQITQIEDLDDLSAIVDKVIAASTINELREML